MIGVDDESTEAFLGDGEVGGEGGGRNIEIGSGDIVFLFMEVIAVRDFFLNVFKEVVDRYFFFYIGYFFFFVFFCGKKFEGTEVVQSFEILREIFGVVVQHVEEGVLLK